MKHKPKKKFGQNFLTAPYYSKKIVESIPAEDGSHVIEIGPGKVLAGLLKRMAKQAKIDNIQNSEDIRAFVG